MSTRNFIRHLEPYGYIDQGKYDKYTCAADVDLSDLYDADKDINDRIDDLCERQSRINNEFAHRISTNTSNISALTDALEDIACRVTTAEETLSAHTEEIGTISGDVESLKESATTLFEQDEFISGVVGNLLEEIVTKADKCELENYYTKDETYAKEEVDAIVSSITSDIDTLEDDIKQWVEDKGYATIEYVDGTFETKDSANEAHGALNEKIDAEIARSTSADTELSNSIEELSQEVDELDGKHDQDIQELRDADIAINAQIGVITSNVETLSGAVDTKASQDDLDAANANIEYLSGSVDTKVSNDDFNAYKASASSEVARIDGNVASLEENKAERSELAFVSGFADSLSDAIALEAANRNAADNALQGSIDALDARVENLETATTSYGQAIDDLQDAIEQEVLDRQNGDTALIGNPNDASGMNTINAAKNYAKELASMVSGGCKTYTDEAVTTAKNELKEYTDAAVSSQATTGYVITAMNEAKAYADDAVSNEASDRLNADTALQAQIDAYSSGTSQDIRDLSDEVSHVANVLKAVTVWDEETPEGYVDDGNGILDVLHKEFHNFKALVEAKLNDLENRVTALEHQ